MLSSTTEQGAWVMGVFQRFAAVFSAIFVCAQVGQIAAVSQKGSMPYVRSLDAKIENKGNEGLSAFGSVIHALHGVDHFRKHYKDGKKNSSKRKLKSLFYKLRSKKNIKTSVGKRFAKFFEKKADALQIRNDIFLSTHFLLTKCGMPALVQTKKITFHPLETQHNQYSKPFTFYITSNQARVFLLPFRGCSKSKTLSQLVKEKRVIQRLRKNEVDFDLRKFAIIVPKDIKEELNSHPASSFKCEIEYLLRIKDSKSIPKILPVYLNRIHMHSSLKTVKKRMIPSTKLEIPIENTPSKVAQYMLVSMIGEKTKGFYDEQLLYYPYACVLKKEKKNVSWVFYDHQRVLSFKTPKRSKNITLNQIMRVKNLYKDVSRYGNLFFYRYIGCKNVPVK
jgi:hypothetical protein